MTFHCFSPFVKCSRGTALWFWTEQTELPFITSLNRSHSRFHFPSPYRGGFALRGFTLKPLIVCSQEKWSHRANIRILCGLNKFSMAFLWKHRSYSFTTHIVSISHRGRTSHKLALFSVFITSLCLTFMFIDTFK